MSTEHQPAPHAVPEGRCQYCGHATDSADLVCAPCRAVGAEPAPHADRDGSECQSMAQHFGIPQDRWDRGIEDIRARMEREHERGLAADVAEPASQPCRTVGYIAGEPFAFLFWDCPDCGHTRLLHPGRHNPKIESCVLCRLVDAVEPKAAG